MDAVRHLAAAHRDVVLTDELLAAGLTANDLRRMHRTGEVVRLMQGVYGVPPFAEPPGRMLLRAATRRSPGALVSCEPALVLHGCDIPFPDEAHVTTALPAVLASGPGLRAHATRVPVTAVTVDGIPVVAPVEALLGAWRDLRDLGDRRAIVCAALTAGVTTSAEVIATDPATRRVPATALLLETCSHVDAGCESPAEIAYRVDVELSHRLPPPRRQQWWRLPNGQWRRFDALYERERLVVEIDGAQHRHDPVARARDSANDAVLAGVGFRVLRFSVRDIEQRAGWVAMQVRGELARRG